MDNLENPRHRRSATDGSGISRRGFLSAVAALCATSYSAGSMAIGAASQIDIAQLIYAGGNWQPRPTALRRLAWEVQKRTAAEMVLEPSATKPLLPRLASRPIAYLAGDRPFTPFEAGWVDALQRYLRSGGMLIVDPAFTDDGDANGFMAAVNGLMRSVLPGVEPSPILPGHVIFHSFYELNEAAGRRKGSPGLTGYRVDGRAAVVVGDHDMGGAWARDNLGNWEHDVEPGGARQRENAFRLGINLVMYALCGDYKDESPHKRFQARQPGGD